MPRNSFLSHGVKLYSRAINKPSPVGGEGGGLKFQTAKYTVPKGEGATEPSPEQGRRRTGEWSNYWPLSLTVAVLNKQLLNTDDHCSG